ncbi:hypothetical protein O5O45_12180 [Hahella aquimaris]|uniref:Uncharacterized protein n=1 Tax=Hahella chejuensis (strain KCTC 2396) TaxID=349521 RepID=Q2SHY6_HAHCH|nr:MULTISPECIES: hypothetical protein [unclassified Hahella]ABC29738.1 hypothetical protein HCH_02968 [Hahella chejuensis KCTC 2396]MBU6953987.1 hypothetical protein [Hahella sp. HN01]MDG9667722.1 hypothetical protein [Hahella sp. CR1]WLQ16678.1 hypothetical protein O5O45_12180 [Hahella sp. HNIBRBA332]
MLHVLLYLLVCLFVAFLGKNKKFGFTLNFFISFIFSPIVGLIVVFAQADKHLVKTSP